MDRIEKYTIAFLLLWALFILFMYGPSVYSEVPYDERQKAKTTIEHILLDNENETVNLKANDVQRLKELADIYELGYFFQLSWHVITAAIMLIMTGFILMRRLFFKKSKSALEKEATNT